MEAIQTLATTITTLTENNATLSAQLVAREADATNVNKKIRDLYQKFVDLEREFSALTKPEPKDSIFENVQDLLWGIEEKLQDVEPEIAHNGRADDMESIVNFTRNSLREMIANEMQKRMPKEVVTPKEIPEVHLAKITPTEAMPSSSMSAPTSIVADLDAKLKDIFIAVIEKQGAHYSFVEELLSFKGVYLTGSVVLKTLINQDYDDPRYWMDVIVTGGNNAKIEKCIENGGYGCIFTYTKESNKEWTRKIYRKSGDKNVNLVVYYHRPIAVKYRTEEGLLNTATFMLPFQFTHNFYDGVNFFVLNKKALRTKTHYYDKVHKCKHVRKFEGLGFKFEVVEKLGPVTFTKKISSGKTFTDLADEISDKWCKDDVIVETVKCIEEESVPEITTTSDSRQKCIVPLDAAGNVGENFKKIIEHLGFSYAIFEKLFDVKAVATGSAVTQALLGEYWSNCHTVTIDVSMLSQMRRRDIENILTEHNFYISHALNNKFGGYVVIYKHPSSSTSRIALKTTTNGCGHPMMFNQNTFDGTSFKISAYETVQKRMHYQTFLTSDFTADWIAKYKERGFEVVSLTNPFLHLSSFSIDKSQIPISTR